jgi:hypothetical protein
MDLLTGFQTNPLPFAALLGIELLSASADGELWCGKRASRFPAAN